MNRFIIKVLKVTILFALLVLGIFFTTMTIVYLNADFKIDPSSKFLLVGHSHSETAYNDSIISGLENYAKSGDSYFYTYPKVKNLIIQNDQINTLFIEFSNNQIDEIMDDWIWDETHLMARLHTYLPFVSKKDIKLLMDKNMSSFCAAVSKSFRRNIIKVCIADFDFTDEIGRYKLNDRSHMDSLIIARQTAEPETKKYNRMSPKNIQYLREIIDFAEDNDLKTYLVRSPQHQFFPYLQNENYFKAIKDSLFADVEFLDFNSFPLKDSEFADFGHLNTKGAQRFSEWFNKLLIEGILTKKNKQAIIDKKMELINAN